MNKDLDDRLIPNGEYRDAQNISVGKSEADDIGALEIVLGNALESNFNLNNSDLQVVGQLAVEERNSIIVFLSDYTDAYTNNNPTLAPSTSSCYIFEYKNAIATKLVEGNFLNFSINKPVLGISIIESLLFFTDNRNQPRKININLASNGSYYKEENDISIAKYNPYDPISLLKKVNTTTTTSGSSSTLAVASTLGIEKGMSVVEYGNTGIEPQDYIHVVNVNGGSTFGSLVGGTGYANANGVATTVAPAGGTGLTVNITVTAGAVSGVVIASPGDGYSVNDVITIAGGGGNATITLTAISNIVLNDTVSGLTSGDTIYFLSTTMTGEDITFNFNDGSAATWPGDPDYLESKFIRLSYRFEYDDGEYSLIAPFTQICFIPKQKGYFLAGQEDEAYRSTIVQFMENGVQNVELLIPFPDTLNKIQPTAAGTYKIKSLDILYKESDGLAVKVIDTIDWDENNENGVTWTDTSTTNVYTYNYQSRKPFRTLPQNQTVRVYDKVPVKALAQETSGNRIIYGNFIDKYNAPSLLNYIIGVGPKSQALNYDNWAEYPNHSVKQNRNYQVGFVLIDKFGRQSDVILSQVRAKTVTTADGTVYGGDTIYAPYHPNNTNPSVKQWLGDSLKINIEQPIDSVLNIEEGTPGLYGVVRGSGFNIAGVTPVITTTAPFTYTFTLNGTPNNIPIIGSYLRGEYTDFVKVTNRTGVNPYVVTCDGPINVDIYSLTDPIITPDTKLSYTINPAGWYSYKIVVKQQEQDYYNCYFPGFLDGYPGQATVTFPTNEDGKTGHVVLLNDNINKVPRDLSEVGPQQKQFRSSVRLYGRVNNTVSDNLQFFPVTGNTQTLPLSMTADTIADAADLKMATDDITTSTNFYQLDTNPLIARLATLNSGTTTIGITDATMVPQLSIAETEPVDSLLDIFWETPTVGLIADLNNEINSSYEGPVGFETFNSNSLTEALNGNFITGLSPVGVDGSNLVNTELVGNFSVRDGSLNSLPSSRFTLTRSAGAPYTYSFGINNIAGNGFVYLANSAARTYIFTVTLRNLAVTPNITSEPLELTFNLQNVLPIINGGNALPVINGVQTAFTGSIGTITGVNGALVTALNEDELVWSIEGGNSNNYFSISSNTNLGTGILSKDSNDAGTVGAHTLTIRLSDAGGYVETTQQINVVTSAIGTPFTASPAGTFNQSCSINALPVNSLCGVDTYYNQTSSLPTENDIIRQGPNGGSSAFAIAGTYSYDCGNTGLNNRKFFRINGNDGKINLVSTC